MSGQLGFLLTGFITAVVVDAVVAIVILITTKNISLKLSKTLQNNLAAKTLNQESTKILKEDILAHFDYFMEHKLTTEMPVLTMFVDDKLIEELKAVFQKEMDIILPAVLEKNLTVALAAGLNDKVNNHLLRVIRKSLAKKVALFILTTIIAGCISGWLCYILMGK